jgi:hypothetical protein
MTVMGVKALGEAEAAAMVVVDVDGSEMKIE